MLVVLQKKKIVCLSRTPKYTLKCITQISSSFFIACLFANNRVFPDQYFMQKITVKYWSGVIISWKCGTPNIQFPLFSCSHPGDAFDRGGHPAWGGGGGDRPPPPPHPHQGGGAGQPGRPAGGGGRDNWYRDDWFNKQEQWQQHDTYRNSYQYHNEADDRSEGHNSCSRLNIS